MFMTQASPRLSVTMGLAVLIAGAYAIYRLEKQFDAAALHSPDSGARPPTQTE
jgi:hypothetical protein